MIFCAAAATSSWEISHEGVCIVQSSSYTTRIEQVPFCCRYCQSLNSARVRRGLTIIVVEDCVSQFAIGTGFPAEAMVSAIAFVQSTLRDEPLALVQFV